MGHARGLLPPQLAAVLAPSEPASDRQHAAQDDAEAEVEDRFGYFESESEIVDSIA